MSLYFLKLDVKTLLVVTHLDIWNSIGKLTGLFLSSTCSLTKHNTEQAKQPPSLSQDVCIKKREEEGVCHCLLQSLLVSLWCLHSLPGAWSCLSPRVLASPDVRGWVTQYITSLHHQHCVHTRLRLTAYYLGWSNVTPRAAHKQRANGHRKSHDD